MIRSQLYKVALLKNQQLKATKQTSKQNIFLPQPPGICSLNTTVHKALLQLSAIPKQNSLETFSLTKCQGGMFEFGTSKFK